MRGRPAGEVASAGPPRAPLPAAAVEETPSVAAPELELSGRGPHGAFPRAADRWAEFPELLMSPQVLVFDFFFFS